MQTITKSQIVLQRLSRNGLAQPFADPLTCIHALAGIQSQFQQYAEVSIMNRCKNKLTMQALDNLYNHHEILNLWGQRNTLHMYVKSDWDNIADLYQNRTGGKNYPELFKAEYAELREFIQTECAAAPHHMLDKKRLLDLVKVTMQGKLTAEDYFDYYLIRACCFEGLCFGLPQKPGIKTLVGYQKIRAEQWRPDPSRTQAALLDLMRRYFTYYGPATLKDFCHWSGLTAQTAKPALEFLKDQLAIYTYEKREYYAYGPEPETKPRALYLLGKFDHLFVSYGHKDWIVPPEHRKAVWRTAAWVEAVIINGDKLIGTWRHTLKGRKMSVTVEPLVTIKPPMIKKITAKAAKLADFWEKELDMVTIST